MPSNLHEYFLAACTGLSVLYILLAWTWCRKDSGGRQRLSLGASILVVLMTWAGLLTVVTSVTLVAVANSSADADSVGRLLQIEAQRLRDQLLSSPRYASPLRLNRFEAKVYSQNGEDGVIAEIFRRIGTTNRFFAEFGAADGSENNTVLLLRQGWSGQWVEGDPEIADRARTNFAPEVGEGRLVVTQAFITAENADELLAEGGAPEELDLFSLDIDRNDYHVWKAIERYRPRVIMMEYNSIFPPGTDWVVDYDGSKWWARTS
jgi:hypothetical protein